MHPQRRTLAALSLLACLTWWLPLSAAVAADAGGGPPVNLLLNPGLGFHALENSRKGQGSAGQSGAVPCWDHDAYRDCEATRAPKVTAMRPRFPVESVVVIHPGKRLSQFVLLSEAGLDPGDRVSLSVFGHQTEKESLRAAILWMQVDGAPGQWRPADFGQGDQRTFAKCARGELTPVSAASATAADVGDFELKIENVPIAGRLPKWPPGGVAETPQPTTIGMTVELANVSRGDVWVYSPCLAKSPTAMNRLAESRPMPTSYRHIPRTIQKLWRGEPLHILHLGYSSDCGDGNPPLYLYDEDPKSPTFKQPLSREFDGAKVGYPAWNDYVLSWNFHFMQWGRMRAALLVKFDYPMDRILLNTMACGGSFLAEAHSGYADYASLAIPPGPANGHRHGKTWAELYPALLARPEGSGPDLVSFGHGKKLTTGNVDEIEQYEGAIRWFQRHYPGVEFIFTVNDWRESFADNAGALRELSLRYGIPLVDFGRALHLTRRHDGTSSPMTGDAHPQAYVHYLWYKQIERTFEAVDPIQPGIAQAHLPERISPHTIGWEGDVQTYTAPHPRIRQGTGFILDDTVVNLWATCKEGRVSVSVDGQKSPNSRLSPMTRRDVRNSTFVIGKLSPGDRHIVEVAGSESRMMAVDAKTALNRQWTGAESPRWRLGDLRAKPFASQWGEPYGARQVEIPAGKSVEIELAGTLLSVAYVDRPGGGTLAVQVDGRDSLRQPTSVAFRTIAGENLMMENRRGIGSLAYGMHSVRIGAIGGPVALLGVFAYDTRANRANERVFRGTAFPGETISLNPPLRARPLVFCTGGLRAVAADTTFEQVRFAGDGPGEYQIVGE